MRPRVLYVDDDRANLLAVSYGLEDVFDMETVECGEQALSMINESRFDAVIIDQRMPGMSGVELCERIQRVDQPPVRIIFTAFVDAAAATDAINSGRVSELVHKPASNEQLRTAVFRSISQARRRAETEALRAAVFADPKSRAIEAAQVFASTLLPDAVTVELCDLLLEEQNREPRFDVVRDADARLHDFFVTTGVRLVERRRLSDLTLDSLRALRPYLSCSARVQTRSDPLVFVDPATVASALLVLLADHTQHVDVDLEHDDAGEGWVCLTVDVSEDRLFFANALMRMYGGSVQRTANGVELHFSRWGDDPDARPVPITRRVDSTVTGHRRGESRVDILFVDDEVSNRTVFKEALTAQRIATCGSAKEAMAVIDELSPAVVVADERMPGMKGTELCAWLCRTHPDIVPVVLTAFGDFKVAQRAAGNARLLLQAPYSVDEVSVTLADCVDEVHAARHAREVERAELLHSINDFGSECRLLGEDLYERSRGLVAVAEKAGLGVEVRSALVELQASVDKLTSV